MPHHEDDPETWGNLSLSTTPVEKIAGLPCCGQFVSGLAKYGEGKTEKMVFASGSDMPRYLVLEAMVGERVGEEGATFASSHRFEPPFCNSGPLVRETLRCPSIAYCTFAYGLLLFGSVVR